METSEILEKYGSLEAFFEAEENGATVRREELLNMFDPSMYRLEALKSLARAETSALSKKEAMYCVALAQVFATLELAEISKRKH